MVQKMEEGQGRKDRGGGGAEEWTEVEVLHAEETEVGQGRKDRSGDGAKETKVGGPFFKGSS
jgi:hypothetical protein